MDNIKDDKYLIKKIIDNIDYSINTLKNISLDDFEKNELICDSICFRFIQMSELAKKISNEFMLQYPGLPVYQLKGLRNRIVHDYGNVDLTIVYYTVKNDLSILKIKLENILME